MIRRLAAVLALGLVLPVLPAGPAMAQGDTTAIAINTKDGFDVFRMAFQIRRATQDVVDTSNAAVAYASCTDCQTVALAIQVVLISGYDSSVVAPENLAIAINESCVLCDTLASAYQFVLTAEGNVRFTAAGNQALAEIRRALLALRDSGLSGAEIQARLDAIMEDLAEVLSTQLVPAGEGGGDPAASPAAVPSADPSSDGSPPPSEPPGSSAEPSGSPEPTYTTQTEEPTAEPSATITP